MVAAKRATKDITDAELVEVAGLTYRDAALALNVGSMATVRLLYQKRGIPRAKRRPGEMADYHTRAPYKVGNERNRRETVNDNPLGLKSDGGHVYVYASSDCFVCGRCQLVDIGCFTSKTRSGMITHLQEHIEAGHHVPECAIKRLREEIETEGDDWREAAG